MAVYKHFGYLSESYDHKFDVLHEPGSATEDSGLYRCEGCGHEIVSEAYRPLPSQNHHVHAPGQGKILWRLIVCEQKTYD